MKITLTRSQFGCFLIESDDGQDILIQSDWDYPGAASSFGWSPCDCGEADGTVDCAHKTADEMIADAYDFMIENDGATADDPGYFE
jgi:hypothetical protein